MSEFDFRRLPQPAILLQGRVVRAVSDAALALLPDLEPGSDLPPQLGLPCLGQDAAGIVDLPQGPFSFVRAQDAQQTILLLSPAPQTVLTLSQLGGVVSQLRTLEATLLLELQTLSRQVRVAGLGETEAPLCAMRQSFCRLLRMTGNLDFLQEAASTGAPFHPVQMDLAGLCKRLATEAGGLLKEGGVELNYSCSRPSMLIPGDPELLTRLVLGLVSNDAKAAQDTQLDLRLTRLGDRAVLSLNQKSDPTPQQLDALLHQPPAALLPSPDQGAGLGLSVIRQIVLLHGGTLLLEQREEGGLTCVVALPTEAEPGRLEVQSPLIQRSGGFSPLLLELSDVLPARLFTADIC